MTNITQDPGQTPSTLQVLVVVDSPVVVAKIVYSTAFRRGVRLTISSNLIKVNVKRNVKTHIKHINITRNDCYKRVCNNPTGVVLITQRFSIHAD